MGTTHVYASPAALQHPGQDSPAQRHWPFVHSSAHMPHAAPPIPHAVDDWALLPARRQLPAELQQPMVHEVAVHAHCPVLTSQASPVGHSMQLRPPTPHSSAVCEALAMHAPVLLQQPFGHVFGPQGGALSDVPSPPGPSPAMVRSAADVSLKSFWGLPSPISGHVSVSLQSISPQPSMSTEQAIMAVAVAAAASKREERAPIRSPLIGEGRPRHASARSPGAPPPTAPWGCSSQCAAYSTLLVKRDTRGRELEPKRHRVP